MMKMVSIREPAAPKVRKPSRKIFDHNGHHVGTVGPLAGVPTVSRFLGHHDVTLKRGAWRANKPSAPTRPDPKLAKSLRADKGSCK